MLDTIRAFIRSFSAPGDEPHFSDDDPRLAVAALLVHCMAVDGAISERERGALRSVLQQRYGLTGESLDQLVADARQAEAEAVDLYRFTSVIKRSTTQEERAQLVEELWQIVFSDGESHEFEQNLLWRVSELLGVDRRTRIASRIAVAENVGTSDSPAD